MSLFYFSTSPPETQAPVHKAGTQLANREMYLPIFFFFFEARGLFLVLTAYSWCLIHAPYPRDTQSLSVPADGGEHTSESNQQ